LAVLIRGDFIVAESTQVLALQVPAWGWVLLALGVIEVLAGDRDLGCGAARRRGARLTPLVLAVASRAAPCG
jgi:hypothetical protein